MDPFENVSSTVTSDVDSYSYSKDPLLPSFLFRSTFILPFVYFYMGHEVLIYTEYGPQRTLTYYSFTLVRFTDVKDSFRTLVRTSIQRYQLLVGFKALLSYRSDMGIVLRGRDVNLLPRKDRHLGKPCQLDEWVPPDLLR